MRSANGSSGRNRWRAAQRRLDHDRAGSSLQQGLEQAEAKLGDDPATGRFSHGDAPTIADLCLTSQLLDARVFSVETADLPMVNRTGVACLEVGRLCWYASSAPVGPFRVPLSGIFSIRREPSDQSPVDSTLALP
jgi:hypothetical protein